MSSGKKKTKGKSKTKRIRAADSKNGKISAVGSGKSVKKESVGGGKNIKVESVGSGKSVKAEPVSGGKGDKAESVSGGKRAKAELVGDSRMRKAEAGKKTGGKAKSRNPNLKLVKNEDLSMKKTSSKETSSKETFLKKASPGETPLREISSKKISTKETSPKENSPKKASSKETPKKEISEKKVSAKEASGKKISSKKVSAKEIPEKEISPKKVSLKAVPSQKTSQKGQKKATLKRTSSQKTAKKAKQKKSGYVSKSYIAYDNQDYADRQGIVEWFFQHKSLVIIWGMVFAVVAALVSAYYYVITNYEVTTVYVDGNIHYSNEEVMEMVMTGTYGNNSLYLAMKYKDKGVEGVPFVERMDVDILAPNKIRISVYEKALAGYVEYLGRYMYFDRDGIVVESSRDRTEGIPQVTGLQFDYVVLNEALPVENDAIFKRILSITQLLDKYELTANRIYFDSDYDLTLYFEGVRVTLGASEEIDEKIMRLQYILPELSGKSGTLSMENYTEDTKLIPFHQD